MLNKALYGLKQLVRLWFIMLKEVLINHFKFQLIIFENCILINKERNIIVFIYVNNLILISLNIDQIKSFIKKLKEFFKLKDLKSIKDYLGINIDYNVNKSIMKLY